MHYIYSWQASKSGIYKKLGDKMKIFNQSDPSVFSLSNEEHLAKVSWLFVSCVLGGYIINDLAIQASTTNQSINQSIAPWYYVQEIIIVESETHASILHCINIYTYGVGNHKDKDMYSMYIVFMDNAVDIWIVMSYEWWYSQVNDGQVVVVQV